MAASAGSKMGSSSVTNYNNHFVGWVRERGRRGRMGERPWQEGGRAAREAVGTDARACIRAGFKPFRCGSQHIYRLVNVP